MRLFIAIELPRSFKSEVKRMQKALMEQAEAGRFVPEDSFHITLHFIGESEDLLGAAKAMREAVRGIHPFTLHLGRYDSFERKDSRTSILQVLGDYKELNALHESLESALEEEGFLRDHKRYVPHITLGRNVIHDLSAEESLRQMPVNASMQVQGIVLFESTRVGGKMVYTPLHREKF